MIKPENQMPIALTISITLIIFNIIAITQGTAQVYYHQFEELMVSTLSMF